MLGEQQNSCKIDPIVLLVKSVDIRGELPCTDRFFVAGNKEFQTGFLCANKFQNGARGFDIFCAYITVPTVYFNDDIKQGL